MKLLKSSARNKLTAAQMSRLLTIQFHGAEIQNFDSVPAIHRWNSSAQRARRPRHLDHTVHTFRAQQATGETSEQPEQAVEALPAAEEEVKDCGPLDSDYEWCSDVASSDDDIDMDLEF